MIEVTHSGAVATVRMDHGPVNATDLELLEAIVGTFADLDADDGVAAVVLAGNARAFSAGVDLRRVLDGGEPYTRAFLDALSRAFLAPLRLTAPVIAAVTGHAIAGGAVLAAACDHAVLTDEPRTRVGLAELAVGVPFPTVAIEVMRRRLGPRLGAAVWLADLYAPEDALARGFVDEVVPAEQVVERATAIATRLAAAPAGTRQLTHEQLLRDVEDAMGGRASDWDARVADVWCSDAGRAAIAAFVEQTLGG